MNAAAQPLEARRRHNRRVLLLLAAIAAFPFVGAWLLYLNPQWLPDPGARGTLLEPPVPFGALALRDLDGRPFAVTPDPNDWLLLAVEPGPCAEACRSRHVTLRQARRAAGMDRQRVTRIVAFEVPPAAAVRERLLEDSPDLRLALASPVLARIARGSPTLLLGDPRGDLVLRYDVAEIAPGDVLKDLKRLLRLSRSW